ncbi:MAG: AbrB/MazE/SpoVT family DNA-binding domain-containing protein [Candidatus Solibacter sp.]
MGALRSRVTSQGQVSVPADIRRMLGIGPGSVLEWEAEGDRVTVRRAGRYTSLDLHRAVFGDHPPKPHTLEELKQGIRGYIRKMHESGRY